MNTHQIKRNCSALVIEDNGGGLRLVVFDSANKIVYIHSGYEYNCGIQLLTDLEALQRDGYLESRWEGNEIDELRAELLSDEEQDLNLKSLGYTEEAQKNGGWCIVANLEEDGTLELTPRGFASHKALAG